MDTMSLYFGMFVGLVFAFILAIASYEMARSKIMQEAYERGHAVQCLGKTGYHWKCEE